MSPHRQNMAQERITARGDWKFVAVWCGNGRLLWLKKDRRSARKTKSSPALEPSARFSLWTDAGKARDALCLTARIYNSHAQQSARGAVSQMANGCAAHD
jgi:hypothetical protein